MDDIELVAIFCLIIGFAAGYGLRSYISHRRRERYRS
jgi:hypothetical protein